MGNGISTWRNAVFLTLFSVLLIVPLLSWLTGLAPASSVQEKRQKTNWAHVQAGNGGNWRSRFEEYFNDQFGFRDQLVSGYNRLDYAFLQSNARVLIGSDGWLFLERGLNANMPPIVDDLCGRLPFTAAQLKHWQQRLLGNWHQLRKSNRQYLLTIVPNKHTLYRTHLPRHLHCAPTTTRLTTLKARLDDVAQFPYIDLQPELVDAASGSAPVYHKTDTHWNRIGVYIAYEKILQTINSNLPPGFETITSVLDTDRIVAVSQNSSNGDLAVMLGLGESINETMEGFRIRRSMAKLRRDPLPGYSKDPYRQPVAFVNPSRASAPRILVFHDSFIGKRVQLLLAETFSHATFVWNSGPNIPFHVIDQVKPDIVIHEMVERSLLQTVKR